MSSGIEIDMSQFRRSLSLHFLNALGRKVDLSFYIRPLEVFRPLQQISNHCTVRGGYRFNLNQHGKIWATMSPCALQNSNYR